VEVGKRGEREELLQTIKVDFAQRKWRISKKKKTHMETRGESRPNSFEVRVFIIYVFFLVYNLSIGTIEKLDSHSK
jgi:hypothetical protein